MDMAEERRGGSVRGRLNLADYLERIRAFDGARFEIAELARVRHRETTHPILSVRTRGDARRTLLVLAGVHGDEQAGLLAVPPILEAWRSDDVRLVVVTPVNPFGADACSRRNAEGRDINRDFVRFATAEARAVRAVFEEVRPDFVISLHEGPQRGTFMFTNRHIDAPLAPALREALAGGGTVLATRDYFGRRLRPPGWAPATALIHAAWSVGAVALRSQATIAYSEERGVPEIVLESSSRTRDDSARVRPHVDLVAAVGRRLGSSVR